MPVISPSHWIALLCACLTVSGLQAQGDSIPAALRFSLLGTFRDLQHKQINDDTTCYSEAATQAPLRLINLVHQYDLEGHHACSRKILMELERTTLPAKKNLLPFLLAKAAYLHAHQLYDTAKITAMEAARVAALQQDPGAHSTALLILSGGALKRRQISQAYQWADSALLFARQTKNLAQEGKALLQMALVARRHFTSSAHRAFPYYLQAMEAAETVNDSTTLFSSNLYYAADNFEISNWAEGLPYYEKAMAIALNSKNVYQEYTACVATGYSLLQLGYIKEPLVLFRQALHISQQQELPYNIQHSFFELTGVFNQARQYDSALYYANLAATVPGVDALWANMWQVKADIYYKMGNYKMAAIMYQKSIEWANEDFLYRNQEQLSGYEAKLKTSEKELQATTEKRKRVQLEWMIGAAVLLLLLAGIGYTLQRKARHTLSVQNIIIEKQRLALSESLGEKEILLKEIHHRVKNNLSVISSLLELQSAGMEESSGKAAILEAQNRVRSIAMIHQRLYQGENNATIDLHSLITELLQQLFSLYQAGEKEIQTQLEIPPLMLDMDTAIPLALIFNELLTNSFKYAFNGRVKGCIQMKIEQPQEGHFVLNYADDGRGLPPGVNFEKSNSMGLRMIYRLSQQLGGDARYTAGPASTFIIRFRDSCTRNQAHG